MSRLYTQCQAKGRADTECSTYNRGRWCERHRDHFRRGIIDKDGNKIRDVQEHYDQCRAKGKPGTGPCTEYVHGRWCRRHQGHWNRHAIDWNGNFLKKMTNKGKGLEFPECLAKGKPGTGKCAGGKQGRFCSKHKEQNKSGIIDKDGNRLRDLIKGHGMYEQCLAKGKLGTGECTEYRGGKFCSKHGQHKRYGIIDKNGNKLRDLKFLKGTGCKAANKGNGHCSTYYGGRWCGRHYGQYKKGIIDKDGNNLRPFKKHGCEKQYHGCIINNSECTTYRGGKYCSKHRSQYKKGIIDETGNVLRGPKKSKVKVFFECIAKNAGTGACTEFGKYGRFCSKHRGQYASDIIDINGKPLRKFWTGNPELREKCHVPRCQKLAGYRSKYCRKHYEDIYINENFDKYPSIIPKFAGALKKEATTWDE